MESVAYREEPFTHRGAVCGAVMELPVDVIAQNPYQPRKYFSREELSELAASIREYGVLQPVTVRLINGRNYELVAGERRLRAAKLAGLKFIPARLLDIPDRDSAVIALVENLQRKDLGFMEEAEGLSNLARDYNMTQEEIARRIGKSQSAVANKLRLLRLPGEVKQLLAESGLTERHARALLRLELIARDGANTREGVASAQLECARRIIKLGLNVKQTEDLVERTVEKAPEQPETPRFKIKTYIKDIRIFTNTIKHAVDVMNESGLNAVYGMESREDGYFVSIVINKP